VTSLEKARIWTLAHRVLGDEVCEAVQAECDARRAAGDGNECVCDEVLSVLLVLP